ncbi:hypothetical protein [Sphingomonas immobilis]|nr:hypothetical protein [Sphingomonas sp. CA1-15]
MIFFCQFGIHRWITKETARAGTTVSRCLRCGALKVRHAQKKKPLQNK